MTNEELLNDLKQFIAAQNSQLEERLTGRMDGSEQRLTARMDSLERKVEDVQAGVGDAIAQLTEHVDERFDDHEKRLGRLEHRTA